MIAAAAQGWEERAACREVDPEVFFPAGGGGVEHAKRVCARCPVRLHCRDFALKTRQEYGVWGGMSEEARRLAWRRDNPPLVFANRRPRKDGVKCGTAQGFARHKRLHEAVCDPCKAWEVRS